MADMAVMLGEGRELLSFQHHPRALTFFLRPTPSIVIHLEEGAEMLPSSWAVHVVDAQYEIFDLLERLPW